MRPIPSPARSDNNSPISGEAGDIAASFAGQEPYKDLISRANTVPLSRIFKHYGIRISEYSRKITCPFKSHKGGRETTPSFYYYSETNSFCCYGCGIGSKRAHGCEFVAAMDGITRARAAAKILDLFIDDVDEDGILPKHDLSERLEIMMDLSNTVREFRQAHPDAESQKFIEGMCWIYDQHNMKHSHTNEALRRIVEEIKDKIISYTCQP